MWRVFFCYRERRERDNLVALSGSACWPPPPPPAAADDDDATTHRKRSCHFYTISNFFSLVLNLRVRVSVYTRVQLCTVRDTKKFLIVYVSFRKRVCITYNVASYSKTLPFKHKCLIQNSTTASHPSFSLPFLNLT